MPTPSRAAPSRRFQYLLVIGVLSAVLGVVTVLQVRSQAEVVRSLEGQDNASLAFSIDELHRGNDALQQQAQELVGQRERLRAGGVTDAKAALEEDRARLRVVVGQAPVHGPGVTLTVDAPLTSLDLQDATNTLRAAGAEALSINDRRVVPGTVFRQSGSAVSIDGAEARGPWTLAAIGDATRLTDTADLMTRSLRADKRVRSAEYRFESDVQIRATVGLKPFVYGTT